MKYASFLNLTIKWKCQGNTYPINPCVNVHSLAAKATSAGNNVN